MVLYLIAVAFVIIILISQASYARKESVTGYIVPQNGVVRVGASKAGVVTEIHATEGDFVSIGMPLVTIESTRITSGGIAVIAEMIRSVDTQLDEIEKLDDIARAQFKKKEYQLLLEREGLRSQREALGERITNQIELVRLAETNLIRLRTLISDGYISTIDLATKEEEFLVDQQALSNLNQQLSKTRNQIRQLAASIDGLPLDLNERLSALKTERASLERQKLQLSDQGSATIVAPVSGTVAASIVVSGDSVVAQQSLLSLVPAGSEFEAHLYVPSRAIGFVTEGQEVRILYDSFDYRRYGVQKGLVTEISSAAVSSRAPIRNVQRSEPSYIVRVKLDHQTFRSNRGEFDLHSDMTLRADIILEKRSIASWLINPVLALRGRT